MRSFPKQVHGLDITTAEAGLVVSNPGRNQVHYLNHTSGLVLILCNGRSSIELIASLLQKQFDLQESPEEDVREAINEFVKEGLVILKAK